jgi:hypothetical protein
MFRGGSSNHNISRKGGKKYNKNGRGKKQSGEHLFSLCVSTWAFSRNHQQPHFYAKMGFSFTISHAGVHISGILSHRNQINIKLYIVVYQLRIGCGGTTFSSSPD